MSSYLIYSSRDNGTNKNATPKVAYFERETAYALKELPQPHVDVAFGFLITNCAPSRPSV
jgi:hypothetical protein